MTDRLLWLLIKIQLACCLVISDVNMSMSTSRARYFLLTLYTFSFDFVLEYSGQEVFKSRVPSCNFFRATQEIVSCYLKDCRTKKTSGFAKRWYELFKQNCAITEICFIILEINMYPCSRTSYFLILIVLKKINQSKSACLSTFHWFREW